TKQYERSRFKKFTLEFFNQIDLSERAVPLTNQYSNHIDSFLFLGEFIDQFGKKIQVLDVKLKTGNKLEQARTMQRNLIAQYLKDHWIDGALVAFYSDDFPAWRLSLVKVEYKFDENGKTKEELSPAKRYSFLVGKDEPTHTAQNQLFKIFEQTTQNPSLAQIEEAFSVEKVTKEFFEEYRKLFEGLVVELKKNHTFINEATKNNINTDNFAKKLLGQIVFLYFLQKKGWLGVPKGKSWGEGDKNFLRNLFDKSIQESKNFFNNYLEKLFYDTLNNQRSNQVDKSYSEYFQSKIPFLNGGLFDPQYDWENSLMYLDNRIFEQMFDIFDRYNFTVREDEPLEKEVAVDPEMLGKVFENLIEENLRKGKGTYYTPREIVHYMCRESLINYLTTEVPFVKSEFIVNLLKWDGGLVSFHNDEEEQVEGALRNIKIVDPACGSGAFLVGMLQEIVRARLLLSAFHNKGVTEYQIKKETIQNCIYGVDIDPGAIEIAKLRLWLSLVVDYDLEEIEPLPNLDYKIMVGNSLIELYSPTLIAQSTDHKKNEIINQLKDLKDNYYSEVNSSKKAEKRLEINSLIHILINYGNQKEKEKIWDQILGYKAQAKLFEDEGPIQQSFNETENKLTQKLENLNKLKDISDTDHFEWHLNFNAIFENGGFDVVIGNPPYLRIQGIQKEDPELAQKYKQLYKSATGAFDLYILFLERGLSLLNLKGILNFILPHKWVNSAFGIGIRKIIHSNNSAKKMISFGAHQVFNASNYTSLLWLTKEQNKSLEYFEFAKDLLDTQELEEALNQLTRDNYNSIDNSSLDENPWVLTDSNIGKVLKKLSEQPLKVKDVFIKIFQGIATSDDKVFVLTYIQEKNELVTLFSKALNKEVEIEKDFLKPFLLGKDVHGYMKLNPNTQIIFPYLYKGDSYRLMNIDYISKVFPRAYKYLEKNKDRLQKREHGIFKDEWWCYSRPQNMNFFSKEKLVSPDVSLGCNFSYDPDGEFYQTTTVYGYIKKESVKEDYRFLLGLMNSKLLWFYLKNTGTVLANGYFRFKPDYLNNFNVPKLENLSLQQPIINYVDQILKIRKDLNDKYEQENSSKISKLKQDIDRLIYKLYNLTLEEKTIIDENVK
ncbi:MAG: Eco57I restriction-modification methylase domain-containing protein, partial [Nanoarchaeota archaeon]|nr:Eco57I restriction-modification methylase domain-containing protein [Nanoarchaeota archaeon]